MWILRIASVLAAHVFAIQASSNTHLNDTANAFFGQAGNASFGEANEVFFGGVDNAFPGTGNASVHPVLLLLQIQTETCGHARWCTINVETNKAMQTCCKACSCDASCKDQNSCCPDYDFGKLNNWPKYGSVYTFVDEFIRWTNLRQVVHDRDHNTTLNRLQQCVRPQVQKSSMFREEAGTYYMTTKCLSDDVDPDVKKRCEFDYYNNPVDPDNLPSFNDLTPVQSLMDGTIYKNKYCSACSSRDQETRPWTASILCVQTQLPAPEYNDFLNPNSALRTLLLNVLPQTTYIVEYPKCNIIFEPNKDQANAIQHYRCNKYDVEGCVNNGTVTVESELCEQYTSPVHIYSDDSDRTLTVYKNAACLACLKSSVTHRECSSENDPSRVKMTMYVPREMAKISATEHVDDMLYEAFPGDLEHGCKKGEIHDGVLDSCRKVFCPSGMFAYNGKCQYYFTKINDNSYVVLLKLTPTSSVVNDTDFATTVYNDLALYDENNPYVAIIDLSVWRWPSVDFLVYLAISLDDSNATYADAINFVRYLLISPPSWKNTNIATGSVLEVSIADYVAQAFQSLLDIRTGEYLSPVFPETRPVKLLNIILGIAEVNVCYLLEVAADEYDYVLNGRAIKLKATGTVAYQLIPFSYIIDATFLVCMKHVLGDNSKYTYNDDTDAAVVTDDDDDDDDNDQYDYGGPEMTESIDIAEGKSSLWKTLEMAVVPGVLACVCLAVLVTCKMRWRQTEADIARSHRQELPSVVGAQPVEHSASNGRIP